MFSITCIYRYIYIYIHMYMIVYVLCIYVYCIQYIFPSVSITGHTPQQLLGLASALSACAPPRAARRRRELLAISFSRSCQPTRTSRFRGNFDLGISDVFHIFLGDLLMIFLWMAFFSLKRRNGMFPSASASASSSSSSSSILMVYL